MFNKILFIFLFLILNLEAKNEIYKGKVLETVNSAGYSYIKIKTSNKIFWAAISEYKIQINDNIEVQSQIWMEDFTSKTLNKTFKNILFAKLYKKNNEKIEKKISVNTIPSLASFVKNDLTNIKEENSAAIEVTVLDLKDKKSLYNNRHIKIIGEITKISLNIMDSNWVHIKDKNGDELIFRSKQANIRIADKIIASGILKTDLDYGSGYTYELIVTKSIFKKL